MKTRIHTLAPAFLPAKLILTLALAACGLIAFQPRAQADTYTNTHPDYYPVTASLDIGTTGYGVTLGWRFSDHLGVSAGGSYFRYSITEKTIEDISYDASLRLLSAPLTLDIYPSRTSSFHFRLGVAYNGNQLTGSAEPAHGMTIDLGGTTYDSTDVGTLNASIKQKQLNAYFSMAGNFFYIGSAHHWTVGGELGIMYGGNPTATLTRTGGILPDDPAINASLKEEQAKVQKYANDVPFWPVLKLSLRYTF